MNKPYKIYILTIFLGVVFVLFGFVNISDVSAQYIFASQDNPLNVFINISDDIYMTNAQDIRVDGATNAILNFGNWGAGVTGFEMDVYGVLKTDTHILSNALYGTLSTLPDIGFEENIWLGDLNDSIQIQGELCFNDGSCSSTWIGFGVSSFWEENGNDIINSNSDSVNVNVGGDDVTNSYNFYVEGTTGLGGDTTIFSNLYFPMAQDHSIKINNSNTGDGGSLTIEAGDAGASSVGGNIYLNPGSGDTGGDVIIGGNVGIGNEDPDVKLVVDGTIRVDGVPDSYTGYRIDHNSEEKWFIGMESNDATGDLILKDTNGGSVRVYGDLRFSGNGDKTIHVLSEPNENGSNLYIHAGGGGGSGTSGGDLYLSGGSGSPNGNVFLANNLGTSIGSVGVGINPSDGFMLDIAGSLRSKHAKINGVDIGKYNDDNFMVNMGTHNNDVYLRAGSYDGGSRSPKHGGNVYIYGGTNSSGDVILAQNGGNVGVGNGISDPTTKLDVDGGIKISAASGGPQEGDISYSDGDFWGYNGTWKSLTYSETIALPPISETVFVSFSCNRFTTPPCTIDGGGDNYGVFVDYNLDTPTTITCGGGDYPFLVSGSQSCGVGSGFGPVSINTWEVVCSDGGGEVDWISIICSI